MKSRFVTGRFKLILGTILIGCVLMLAACSSASTPSSGENSASESTIGQVMLQVEDLPSGWRVGGEESEKAANVEKTYVWFYGTSDPDQSWIGVSESMDAYSQPEQAIQAFKDLVIQSFPPKFIDSWKSFPTLGFAHHADEWKVACLPAVISGNNSLGCKAVARYGNAVVRIMSNVFDEQWMTMSDFRAVLEAADKRLMTYSQ
jgi:hypothetical protein